MIRTELLRLARVGASARLMAIEREVQALRRYFPHLRAGASGSGSRRRTISDAGRRAVSQAQKRRWAEWRKKQKLGRK